VTGVAVVAVTVTGVAAVAVPDMGLKQRTVPLRVNAAATSDTWEAGRLVLLTAPVGLGSAGGALIAWVAWIGSIERVLL
jgi:hypothetical protein